MDNNFCLDNLPKKAWTSVALCCKLWEFQCRKGR
jgi:hypothetical protein